MSDTAERPGRILVVDDDEYNRSLLSKLLESQGYTVTTAATGEAALEAFQCHRVDLILMDVIMPGMGGLNATRRIKQLVGERFVPVIFHSFLDQDDVLADCVAAGGDDFLPKPHNRVVLNAKIDAMLRQARLHATVRDQRDELARHRERLRREHEVAEQVFANVAHTGCLDLPQIRYLMSPTSIVNGDLLLAARQPDGGVLVLIGDGTGHGLPAAVTALPAAEVFYAMARKGYPIAEIVADINSTLKEIVPPDLFFAACLFQLDEGGRMLQAWNGGMPDLLVVTASGAVRRRLAARNLPLGVTATGDLDTTVAVEKVYPGERLYAFSDGLVESDDPRGERFGIERLSRCLSQTRKPEARFDAIRDSLARFRAGTPPRDDTTLIEVACAQPFAPVTDASARSVRPYRRPLPWRLVLELTPQAMREYLPIPGLVQALVDVQGIHAHRERLYVVLAELYSNALEHGLMELDSDLKADAAGFHRYYEERANRLAGLQAGWITIELAHRPVDQGGEVLISVEDSGAGFDLREVDRRMQAGSGYHGRGIPLVRSVCQALDYPGCGNRAVARYLWS